MRRVSNVMEVIRLDPESNRLITFTPFTWIADTKDQFRYEGGSRIMARIMQQNGWTEDQLNQEINHRKTILQWMIKNNLKSYKDVSQIISDYHKKPDKILGQIQRDLV